MADSIADKLSIGDPLVTISLGKMTLDSFIIFFTATIITPFIVSQYAGQDDP